MVVVVESEDIYSDVITDLLNQLWPWNNKLVLYTLNQPLAAASISHQHQVPCGGKKETVKPFIFDNPKGAWAEAYPLGKSLKRDWG